MAMVAVVVEEKAGMVASEVAGGLVAIVEGAVPMAGSLVGVVGPAGVRAVV